MILFDICGLLLIALGCSSGYFLGFQKGMTRFFFFIITVIAGFLLAEIFSSLAYNFDFSNHNLKVSGIRLRTLPGLLRSLVAIYVPEIAKHLNEAYYFNLLLSDISKAIFRVVFFIVWIIIAVPIIDCVFLFKKGKVFKFKKGWDKIYGLVLGFIQSFILIVMISSSFNGIYGLKTSFENKEENPTSALTMKLSGNFMFDRLFKTDYRGEEILFRKDIESLYSLQKNFQANEDILIVLADLESTEIVSATIVELYFLSKGVALDEEMISSIGKIPYRKELKHLYDAYQLLKELDLKEKNLLNWDENIIQNISLHLSQCSILDFVCSYLIYDYLPNYINLSFDINVGEVLWTKEIRIISEIFGILKSLGIKNSAINDFKNDQEMITHFVHLLFESDLFINNQEVLINHYATSYLPEEIRLIQINNLSETELANILLFIAFLNENDYFEDDFVWTKFLTDQNVEKMVEYISQSNILIDNLDLVLRLFFLDSVFKIETIILPDVNWKLDSGKTELKCFFELFRIFNIEKKYQKEVLTYCEAFLRKNEISALIYLNSESIIDYLIHRLLGKDFTYLKPDSLDSNRVKTELMQLIRIYQELVKSEVLYTKSLKSMSEENISAFSRNLTNSEFFKLNFDLLFDYFILKSNLPFKDISNPKADLTEKEISDLLIALRLLEDVKDEEELFLLEKAEIDKILNSEIIFLIIKDYLYQLDSENHLVISLSYEDETWKEEMINFFTGVKLILEKNENIGIRNINLNIIENITTGYIGEDSDDLTTIIKSRILFDTIIARIYSLKRDPNTREGVLIIDIYEEDWFDGPPPLMRPGELRNFVRGLQIIYKELEIDLNNPVLHRERLKEISAGTEDTNGDGIIDDTDDNDLREIIKSKILSDTLIFLMYEEITT
ncbi:MAG: hypothetical protein ACOX43_08895 [Bacilli bacterium]|jgi:hypothetical protein